MIPSVFLDVDGLSLTKEDTALLAHPLVAGVILFTKNFSDTEQLRSLCESIHAINSDLVIGVDQEGGRVQRFRTGISQLGPMRDWGEMYDRSPERAIESLQTHYRHTMTDLKSCGIDMNIAPVLDVFHEQSTIINNRAFSDNVNVIVELAGALIDVSHELDMPVCGKHFPGHGSVEGDSHLMLPVDDRPLAVIEQYDLIPFARLVDQLDYIMPAHIVYSAVDNVPAGFSDFWMKDVLREQLGFKGKIISDCLSMAGAEGMGSLPERAKRGLSAGCDYVTICNNRQGAMAILDSLDAKDFVTT